MKKILLDGFWKLKGGGYECEGTVPGSVLSALIENGIIDDPYYRDNEDWCFDLLNESYEFSRDFNVADVRNELFFARRLRIGIINRLNVAAKHIRSGENTVIRLEKFVVKHSIFFEFIADFIETVYRPSISVYHRGKVIFALHSSLDFQRAYAGAGHFRRYGRSCSGLCC